MIECFFCRGEISEEEAAPAIGEWILCEECYESPTIRNALLCDLEEEAFPCWICNDDVDHRDFSLHVGGWVVCQRCYREYHRGRLHGHYDEYNWLMSENCEVERFARALREEDENWLCTQVTMLDFERGES